LDDTCSPFSSAMMLCVGKAAWRMLTIAVSLATSVSVTRSFTPLSRTFRGSLKSWRMSAPPTRAAPSAICAALARSKSILVMMPSLLTRCLGGAANLVELRHVRHLMAGEIRRLRENCLRAELVVHPRTPPVGGLNAFEPGDQLLTRVPVVFQEIAG